MGESVIKLVNDTINRSDINALSGWLMRHPKLTKGDLCESFEQKWSEWLGTKHSLFVNSGSSANLLMASVLLESNKLKNKKVIVPAVSWATTVAPFIQLGYEPILCDCDKNNFGLDVNHFEKLVQEHDPAVVIIVHVLGWANSMDEILDICKRYNVMLLEDCCEAHGCEYKGKKVGQFGHMSSFSFYYGHHMSTIEGGMVCTNDTELQNLGLMLRSHGWIRDLPVEEQKKWIKHHNIDDFNSLYFFMKPGYNLRSTEINAFLGLRQLSKLDENISKRNQNLAIYCNRLKEKLWLQNDNNCTLPSPLAFGIVHENKQKIANDLIKNNIECRPLICGSIGRHPFWQEKYGWGCLKQLPISNYIHDFGMYLPCHQDLKEEEIHFVCDIIERNL